MPTATACVSKVVSISRGPVILTTLILASLFLLSSSQPEAPPPPAANVARLNRTNNIRRICVVESPPLAYCEGRENNNFTGYDVDLFRAILDFMEFNKSLWEFNCFQSRAAVIADLLDEDAGTCYAIVGGAIVDQLYIGQGVVYSYPTYKQGIRIMIESQPRTDMWSIFSSFDLEVWLALIFTSIFAGVLVWFFEEASAWRRPATEVDSDEEDDEPRDEPTKKHWKRRIRRRILSGVVGPSVKDTIWGTTGTVVGVAGCEPMSLASRIILFAYGFMILIMIALYTAAVAADIVTTSLNSNINSFQDLKNFKVGAIARVADDLKRLFDVDAIVYEWDSSDDQTKLLDDLRNNVVDAIVHDDSFIRYWDSQDCSLFAVGDATATGDLAFAFPPGTPSTVTNFVNLGMLQLQREEAIMDTLEKNEINLASKCPSADPDGAFQVTFQMVAGLWVILLAAMGCSVLLLLPPMFLVWLKQRRHHKQKSLEAKH
eukprot:gene15608-21713_t